MIARCAAGLASVILLVTACAHLRATELSRDRATTIAKTQVRFDPFAATADRTRTSAGTVWRVVLKGRLRADRPRYLRRQTPDRCDHGHRLERRKDMIESQP